MTGAWRSPGAWLGLVGALLLALVAAAAVSPAVRAELRASFTRLPSEYTELYFTRTPSIGGTARAPVVTVPVSLMRHGAADITFTVRVVVTARNKGTAQPAVEKTVDASPGTAASVSFDVKVARDTAYVVDVTLPGHSQTLHYLLDTKDDA
ncbi:hypothetical protein [Actinoplanes regularis]|uniref:hypothetical protein n=1 Tax=Actinoplanes regularis TaxID=52697 RepID=UPI0024A57957|nr:hypothetical protein [Actinoplanes regularis]GLW33446.1 hypothetical protein Areg01_63840 [Actinoplanes regularis]